MFRVIATFQNSKGEPLQGSDYTVSLRDEDRLFDDKLDTSKIGLDGVAEFMIFIADIKSLDSPNERTPDLYFVVYKGSQEVFRSDVFNDVDFEVVDPVTGRTNELTKEFGPFLITNF